MGLPRSARTRLALTLAGLALGAAAFTAAILYIAGPGLPNWAFYALPWLASVGLAVGAVARRPLHEALGLALMTVPVWDTSLGILASFEQLVAGGVVLRPYTTFQLSGLYSYKLVSDLGYLGAGFLVFAGGRHLLRLTSKAIASRLAATGFPLGRRSEGASVLLGFVAFPVLLAVTILANEGLSGFQSLQQSDESSLFANMTPFHAIVLSLAAAFGEELLYRGLVQTFLARAFGAFTAAAPLARNLGLLAAVVVQALFFGFAHSGYATWIHVLLPALFGLVAGFVAWRLGIWAAIVLHLLVDVFAFGFEASAKHAWVVPVLNTLLLANIVASLAWAARWVSRRLRRPNGQAPG